MGGLLSPITRIVGIIFVPLFYKMFLKDLTKTIFRGERYIDGLCPSDQAKLLEITEKNEGYKKIDTHNWFYQKMKRSVPSVLVGDWTENKDMIKKGLLKIKERLSYQEFIFLFDRVETLEQSDEVQKLQTEIKEQLVKHETEMKEMKEQSVKHETEKKQMKEQSVQQELALKEQTVKLESEMKEQNEKHELEMKEQREKHELALKE